MWSACRIFSVSFQSGGAGDVTASSFISLSTLSILLASCKEKLLTESVKPSDNLVVPTTWLIFAKLEIAQPNSINPSRIRASADSVAIDMVLPFRKKIFAVDFEPKRKANDELV
jgi:hypothetical protein